MEAGSGGMPTAFMAVWKNGTGPTIATYVEYDVVPGNCHAASSKQEPRKRRQDFGFPLPSSFDSASDA